MKSLRCGKCGTHWPPNIVDYRPCPECGAMTWADEEPPIELDEAHSRKLHARFERYWQAWLNGRIEECIRGLHALPEVPDPVTRDECD